MHLTARVGTAKNNRCFNVSGGTVQHHYCLVVYLCYILSKTDIKSPPAKKHLRINVCGYMKTLKILWNLMHFRKTTMLLDITTNDFVGNTFNVFSLTQRFNKKMCIYLFCNFSEDLIVKVMLNLCIVIMRLV